MIHRPIVYGNTAVLLTASERETLTNNDHTHRWTVGVRSASSYPPTAGMKRGNVNEVQEVGGMEDISYFVKKVVFKLHETYPSPVRSEYSFATVIGPRTTLDDDLSLLLPPLIAVDKPPFQVVETGWGEFEIQIKVFFVSEAQEKPIVFYHHLKLHPWPNEGTQPPPPSTEAAAPVSGGEVTSTTTGMGTTSEGVDKALPVQTAPVHSWQYDEIVFPSPPEPFLNILMQHAPNTLPSSSRFPSNANPPGGSGGQGGQGAPPQIGSGGIFGEISKEAEKSEAERLEDARRKVLDEIEDWRKRL